jgi:hypothetical protein
MEIVISRTECLVQEVKERSAQLRFNDEEVEMSDVMYCWIWPKGICFLGGLINNFPCTSENLIMKIRVVEMKLIRIDSDHRAYIE